jgi:hypothetical protein
MLAVTAVAATSLACNVWLLAIGAVAFAGALWIELQRRDLAVERAVVAGIAFNVLARAKVDTALGVTALIGIGCGLLVVVLGVRRRGRKAVRWVTVAGLAVGAFAVLAMAGAAVSVANATSNLRAGNSAARAAVGQS